MCECGCSEGPFAWRLPAPDDRWYVLRVFGGCDNCQAPAGIDICMPETEDMQAMLYNELPVLDLSKPMIGLAVLHPDALKKHIAAALVDVPDLAFAGEPIDKDGAEVLASDVVDESFDKAMKDTANDHAPAVLP